MDDKYKRQRKWAKENQDTVCFQMYKGWSDELQKFANKRGISKNRLIIEALEAYTGLPVSTNKLKIEREKEENGGEI